MNSSNDKKDDQALVSLREKIDAIDEKVQSLVNERAQCAMDIAAMKLSHQGNSATFYRPEREAQILRRVLKRNNGPLSDDVLTRLFREIMSACRALEKQFKIAYLGPEGTFTQEAAYKQFGHSITTVPLASIDAIFREVEAGNASYGVVPIENTTEGVVNHTLDSLVQSPLQICGEVELRIHHHLMSKTKDFSKIKRVYSHQQSFAQCRLWLNKNIKDVEMVVVASNGEGAMRAAQEQNAAAIAGDSAAQYYQLDILVNNIEDQPENTTRFLIIGKKSPASPSGNDKTSLLLSTQNYPGALYGLLRPLAESGISMTRIESRPSRRGGWDYIFFVDIEGHQQDSEVAEVLQKLRKEAALFKVLGSYPSAVV